MRVRLSSPALLERWHDDLAGALEAAVRRQRSTMAVTLAAHGVSWSSPRGSAPPGVWSEASWAAACQAELEPAARKVAGEIIAGMHAVIPATSRWGMGDPTDTIATLVVRRAIVNGERLAQAIQPRNPRSVLSAAGANLSTIGSALDDAAASLAEITGRAAGQMVAGAQTDLAEALDSNLAETINQVWATMGDDRVRPAHEEMEDQVRPAGEPFEDGDGNLLMYPGDPSAPDETTENCRCELLLEGSIEFVNVGPGGSQEAISDAINDALDALEG